MGSVKQQAIPSGSEILKWALANAPALADLVSQAIEADRPREVWAVAKEAGDIFMDLIDPQTGGIKMAGLESVPWDQIISIMLPVLLELIRKRREQRGK